jgi:hypothetical protein
LKTLNFRNNLLEPLTPEDEAGFETFISLPSGTIAFSLYIGMRERLGREEGESVGGMGKEKRL